ncbi:MAG TPA: hypothetical protein VGK75_10735 [Casimicrobiaceae bacterium]
MSIYAPFRFLVAVAMALLIAAVIASSTAHGMALGNALAQSTLGSPLRAVIPISTAPGEVLQAGCFRVVPAGDESAQTVTARVSLERTASAFRLVVTTENPVIEPAVRFGIQAGCETMSRRDYVLLLNPQVAGAPAAAAVQPTAREPGQERPVLPPAAGLERQQLAAMGAAASTAFRPIGTRTALPEAPVAQPVASFAVFSRWSNAFGYLAASLVAVCTIAFVVVMRRRRAPPPIPQWTRGGSYAGPSSFTNLSAPPATLSPLSYAEATTIRGAPSESKPRSVASAPIATGESTASRTRTNSIAADASTIDTLLDELDPDVIEERAVREAWAAARSNVEHEMDGNAILQAIEAAERELLLVPPAPAQAAIDNSLDDDLLHPQQRPGKAAA